MLMPLDARSDRLSRKLVLGKQATVVPVEHERRMRRARADALELPLAVERRRGLLVAALRMEPDAPAAAEHAVVPLHERRERVHRDD